MRTIDLETWPRREHFRLFTAKDFPYFSLVANVDLTAFYPVVKQRGIAFTIAIAYVIARAANEIPEFRYRIRGREVVEHEIVHPSITILTGDDLFSFCTFVYTQDFSSFAARATEQIAYVKEHHTIEDEPGRDDYLFMTAIPWISFTSLVHPVQLSPADSVPRIAWGRYFGQGEGLQMPLNLQAHHALIDGIHAGRFYEKVQYYLRDPDFIPD